jgi:hypothetical protein
MNVKLFKYLGRVFVCPLKFIDMDEMSDEVKESLKTI